MPERRYRLLVRAVELPHWVESSFGATWANAARGMSWPEVLLACRDAVRSPGARHRVYRVVRDV